MSGRVLEARASRDKRVVGAPSGEKVLRDLSQAALDAENTQEFARVYTAVNQTPGLTESGIAPDVLDALLPDKEIIELPRVRRVSGSLPYRFVKRAFDICSCSVALILLAIPMAVIALKIKKESAGPVIYAQRRVGKNGRVFELYKFRSMYQDAEVHGARWAKDEDPRVTPFGRFLRNKRLDEIPQFWNVVRGDMSLIGPRPERPAFHKVFCERIHGWEQRVMVKPGITGLAQVEGGYDLLPKEKARIDIAYIESRSLRLDLGIVFRTIRTMISGEGAR